MGVRMLLNKFLTNMNKRNNVLNNIPNIQCESVTQNTFSKSNTFFFIFYRKNARTRQLVFSVAGFFYGNIAKHYKQYYIVKLRSIKRSKQM